MASKVQTTGSVINFADLRAGELYAKNGQTFLQDASRAADLECGTIVAQYPLTLKWVPLTTIADVEPISAKAVCGANGGNLAAWAAVSDGEFAITVDGVAHSVTGLDTSAAIAGGTSGKMVCGANGGNLGAYQAVGDGEFSIIVDGTVRDITGIVLTSVVALTDVVGILSTACAGLVDVEYDALGDVFTFVSRSTGATSSASVLTAVSGGSGTDISGASFLNGLTAVGTPTAGTGSTFKLADIADVIQAETAGYLDVLYDEQADVFTFVSKTTGLVSTITVLSAVAAGAGTDISGSGFLNGLAATLTQGDGYDGTEIPSGVILETIEAADLVSGDVTDIKVGIGGSAVVFREGFLVLENSLTMASVVESQNKTIERLLREISIYPQETQAIESLQT